MYGAMQKMAHSSKILQKIYNRKCTESCMRDPTPGTPTVPQYQRGHLIIFNESNINVFRIVQNETHEPSQSCCFRPQ